TRSTFGPTRSTFGPTRSLDVGRARGKLDTPRPVGVHGVHAHRHLEAYFAIPCMGAVLHPLNLRLHPNELGYIARHAEDRLVLVDESLLPLLQQFLPQVPSIEHVIVLRDGPPSDDGRLDYETLLAAERHGFEFRRLEENQAAIICYTSGTTGNPKGVAYSHRSTVLHTLVACMADTIGVSEADSVLLTQHLEARFAKFWLPDDYVFVHQIPRTSTGKFQKLRLREEHGDLLVRRRPTP
ncbi:MAG: AMP-binding protein, partial [Myxococcales bacterium]